MVLTYSHILSLVCTDQVTVGSSLCSRMSLLTSSGSERVGAMGIIFPQKYGAKQL